MDQHGAVYAKLIGVFQGDRTFERFHGEDILTNRQYMSRKKIKVRKYRCMGRSFGIGDLTILD
jgi:hypothetical protein